MLHGPLDVAFADREDEALDGTAARLVRRGEYFATFFILDIDEASWMVRIVRLLGLHEGFGLDVGSMGVLGRLGLHELRGCEAAAGDLNHHLLIPQESISFWHSYWAVQFIAVAVLCWAMERNWIGIWNVQFKAMASGGYRRGSAGTI